MRSRGGSPRTMAAMASRAQRGQEIGIADAVGLVLLGSLMFWPRLFMVGFWIFDRQIGDAFGWWALPFIGFVVLPWTTVVYAAMWSITSESVTGIEWIPVGIAVLLDLWTWSAFRR
jgi:hypothetical protein